MLNLLKSASSAAKVAQPSISRAQPIYRESIRAISKIASPVVTSSVHQRAGLSNQAAHIETHRAKMTVFLDLKPTGVKSSQLMAVTKEERSKIAEKLQSLVKKGSVKESHIEKITEGLLAVTNQRLSQEDYNSMVSSIIKAGEYAPETANAFILLSDYGLYKKLGSTVAELGQGSYDVAVGLIIRYIKNTAELDS